VSTAKYSLPDVKLVDMVNKEFSLPAIFDNDKPTMVNFIFTTCTTICPIMTATFAQAQDMLGPDLENVQMVSISIDPEQDTPEKLLEYAFKYQAAPVWNFYTGKKDDVITALKAFDAYRGDKMNHEAITLIRKNKESDWVRLEGLTSAADLIAEYKKVIAQ
jgi:protein SCO1/2